MTKTNEISILYKHANDGRKFYRAVMERLSKLPGRSLNALCTESEVSFSTTWRWKNEGSKPDADTIEKLEATFGRWEKVAHQPNSSSSSGSIPSACR